MNVRILLACQHCLQKGSLTCLGRTHLELTGVNHMAAEMNAIAQNRKSEPRTSEAPGIKQTRDCGAERPLSHADSGGTDIRAGARFGFAYVVPAAVELLQQANSVKISSQISSRSWLLMLSRPPPHFPASDIAIFLPCPPRTSSRG